MIYKLIVKETDYNGRGVFAGEYIPSRVLIIRDHILVMSREHTDIIRDTIINDYYFSWYNPLLLPDEQDATGAIVLGLGSLINDKYPPNVKFNIDYTNKMMEFRTVRDIQEGEELLISYHFQYQFLERQSMKL
jgi:uncharacterized protein